MITLSNGHTFQWMIASGAMAFDGRGWIWERPLVALGLIQPELFTTVIKTLTRHPREGNLRWWKPWECVALIEGGAVNKVGLTNPGIEYWCKHIAPKIDFERYPTVGSIYGNQQELVESAVMLNDFPLVANEVNYSCPNAGTGLAVVEALVDGITAVAEVSRHPVIVKVSAAQDYNSIAVRLKGIAQAISINSVPWELAFQNRRTPLHGLETRVKGGGGGVSGRPAQRYNWIVVQELVHNGHLPVIAPSIMEESDVDYLRRLGADAFSFGTIHLPTYPIWRHPTTLFTNPLKPTTIVKKQEHKL